MTRQGNGKVKKIPRFISVPCVIDHGMSDHIEEGLPSVHLGVPLTSSECHHESSPLIRFLGCAKYLQLSLENLSRRLVDLGEGVGITSC